MMGMTFKNGYSTRRRSWGRKKLFVRRQTNQFDFFSRHVSFLRLTIEYPIWQRWGRNLPRSFPVSIFIVFQRNVEARIATKKVNKSEARMFNVCWFVSWKSPNEFPCASYTVFLHVAWESALSWLSQYDQMCARSTISRLICHIVRSFVRSMKGRKNERR